MDAQARTLARREFKGVGQLAVWTLAWVASLALAVFGPALLWNEQPVLTWIALAVTLAVGAGFLLAHVRYLHAIDDLQRKILLESLSIAVGVGLVGGCAAAAAHGAGVIGFEPGIPFIVVLMAIVYALATAVATFRYR